MSGDVFAMDEWQIRLVLPHRPPVLQLDKVTACAVSLDRLEAIKALAGSDAMVRRSAGGQASLAPGAVLEALAQCCGLLLRLRWLAHHGADLLRFASGDSTEVLARDIPRSVLAESSASFGAPFAPGTILRLAVRLILSRGDMHQFEGMAHDGPERILKFADARASRPSGAAMASARIMLNFPRLTFPDPTSALPGHAAVHRSPDKTNVKVMSC